MTRSSSALSSAAEAAELRAALDQVEQRDAVGCASSQFEAYKTVRIYNLLATHQAFWRVPVHASVLPIAERVLDPELLSSLSAITLGPEQAAQPLHEDTQQIPLNRPSR